VASWDVYVTLEPPPFPEELARQVAALDHTFDVLEALSSQGLEINLAPQRLRRDRIRATLQHPNQERRLKRGLLDIGGTVLSALFGVATHSQLDRFKAAMQEVQGTQLAMSHAVSHLATIINQTRANVISLARNQQKLNEKVAQIDASFTAVAQAIRNHGGRLHRVEMVTDLDRYLDILDLAARDYDSQITLFHRQRAELELGHLTRDLLSQPQLEEILAKAAAQHKVLSTIEWYYQFLAVTPIWHQSNALIYRIELPLIAPRPYLLYHVITHEVPLGNSTFSAVVNLKANYALDTISGNLFVPEACVGHDPTVCQNGPEYGPGIMPCARGVITNRPELVKKCSVSLRQLDQHSIISKIKVNQFAVASQGETIVIRCPGATESHTSLTRGTYNLTCARPCTVTGAGWSITCIDHLYLSRTYVMPAVRVTAHFNLSLFTIGEPLQNVLDGMQGDNAPLVLDMPMETLLNPPLPPVPTIKGTTRWPTPSPFTIINLSLLATFWLILSVAYLHWRRRRAISRRQTRAPSEIPEALPLASAPHEPPSQPSAARIWPILPPLSDCGPTSPGLCKTDHSAA